MDTTKPLSTIMTRQTICVFEEDHYFKIEDIFRNNLIHHIPVIDADKKVVGIISLKDMSAIEHSLLKQTTGKTYSQKSLNKTTAKEIMTPQPVQLEAEDTIGIAAEIILTNHFHALPIVHNDVLVGIVTNTDLLMYAYGEKESI